MKTIRVGSRDSKLAVLQAQMVIAAIQKYDSSIQVELVTMKTTGDKILNVTLDKIGGKGLFVKELDDALLNGQVDLTVHSYKDMPMELNPALPVVAVSEREDPRDVLILRADMPGQVKVLGSSSKRRMLQLRALGYEEIEPLRGNVQTRLSKLDGGQYDGIVLAAAGIHRLQLQERINRYFDPEEILPSACQGILAVQARAGEDFSFLSGFHSRESEEVSLAERAFVRWWNGGCSSPIAAYATLQDGMVKLCGMYVDEAQVIYRDTIMGAAEDAEKLGIALAEKIKESIA